MNLDGKVQLDDAFLLHGALVTAGLAGLDFSLLTTSVPEPASWMLAVSGVLALTGRREKLQARV